MRTAEQLREDALAIWQAGLAAVRSERLIADNLHVDGPWLVVGDEALPLAEIDRIAVVGAGKAGAGMAAAVEDVLGPEILAAKRVEGWVNVPADCVRPLGRIHLHAARPAGVNEPTAEGAAGARRILEIVGRLGPRDLCLCLISGGGSALLPAPAKGISLADKQAVTRLLSAAGANIEQLNRVRKRLSLIKGGGLARACRAGRLISLIISDVLGDPLEVIASGPTTLDQGTAKGALEVLDELGVTAQTPPAVLHYLRAASAASPEPATQPFAGEVSNIIIGNNAVAVDAAGVEAERRGYSHAMHAATSLEGNADEVGIHLAEMALRMRAQVGPDCLITGGEPTVKLAPAGVRGRGGRNQQLVLAALSRLLEDAESVEPDKLGIALLSGGTDGEDGPTDAAGAILDGPLIRRMRELHLEPQEFLARNDAYRFFEPLGGLLKTGPTHTNVCDVRVAVVSREA